MQARSACTVLWAFQPAGVLNACGWKFDQWLDVVMMQRSLGPGSSSAPSDLRA
jgi:L-amino acid N-acyltransferase YncA